MQKSEVNVGMYLRLSRDDKNDIESSSITSQRLLISSFIKENGYNFIDEYIDDGVSGISFDREGFNRLINDCKCGRINTVITKDSSRLGRDHIEFGYYVEKFFPENNIRFIAINDGIDTFKDYCNNDFLMLKSIFNDLYVKDISNKQRSSLYAKKKNGLFVGAYAPYGYIKSKDDCHILEINESEAVIVKKIFNMFIEGFSINYICNFLTDNCISTPSISKKMNINRNNHFVNVWSTRTVSDILKNTNYIGTLNQCKQKKINYKSKKRVNNSKSDWVVVENVIPSIVDKDTFYKVQEMFNKNINKVSNKFTKVLLRGLIFCKECGHTIGFRTQRQLSKKNGVVSRCYGNCNYWIKRKKYNVCSPHNIKYIDIESIVFNDIFEIIKNNIDFKSLNSKLRSFIQNDVQRDVLNLIDKSKAKIEQINKKIDICYNDKLDGLITAEIFQNKNYELTKKLEYEKIMIKKYYSDLKKFMDVNYNNNFDISFFSLDNLRKLSFDFYFSLIDKIEVSEDKQLFIYYKFSGV